MSTLNVDKVDPSTGTALELGTSGDTITVPTGAGLTVVDEVKTNKISPATGTAFALGDSGDTFTVPSGATIVNSGTATGFGITSASFLPYSNPVIINGNMKVAQRATSVTGITTGGYRTCDRFEMRMSNFGTWTITQEALSADEAFEDGFSTAFKLDNTTADASLGASDYGRIHYAIEAQDCQLFKLGNAGSDTITVAFWVKATKTGTNVVAILQSDSDRLCCQSYTIDATDTWEHKVLNFPADTAGAGINNDNGEGLEIDWWTGSGTTYTSGTLQTTWAARVNANRAVGQVNHADSTSNNFHLTGVQVEAGTYTSATLPPFRHESYGDNLARCQRYFVSSYKLGYYPGDDVSSVHTGLNANIHVMGSSEGGSGTMFFPSGGMRKLPTMKFYARDGTADQWYWGDMGVDEDKEATSNFTGSPSQYGMAVYTATLNNLNANICDGAYTADAEL